MNHYDPSQMPPDKEYGVFLSLRIKMLKQEAATLREQQTALQQALRTPGARKDPEAREKRQRLIYSRFRLPEIKSELSHVIDRKKAIGEHLKPIPAAVVQSA